ncbi:hypothetical protein F5876DRAFT_74717 [Lentinula aff. lateritia]|uniref:Uncharacterized protein n=1 Tax=Lentinula aff. lateritia TaxID=2804960 RepID=A0ACC1U6Z3_9AGAR|nr:hypothetical protein F5876DRAFT_74717 [Lentinula aff. lateritia]
MFNSRSPPTGAPPSYVSRLSAGRSLRSIVMLFAFLSALYTLLSYVLSCLTLLRILISSFRAIGNFRSISIDRGQNESKLATFSLVLGILYITVFAFETFGIAATLTQRQQLVHVYAMLSFVTVLIATGGGLLNVIVHFTMKNDIIDECTNLVTGDDVVFYPFGFFGPVSHNVIDAADARDWCQSEWDHDSWADIVELLILIFLSMMFSLFSYAYYRQLLDPTSAANVVRTPIRAPPSGFPSHYNPAYNASVPSLGYQYGPYGQQPYGQFAPPPGPPPAMDAADGKPPGYASGPGYGYEIDDKAKENPFADFDEHVDKAGGSQEEHDVTSRPAPGGRDTFV